LFSLLHVYIVIILMKSAVVCMMIQIHLFFVSLFNLRYR
jgi:hypothetical protein